MQISEESFHQMLNEIDELKNQQVDAVVSKINFKELKPDTAYIVEFSEDMDVKTMWAYMQKIMECTQELNNKYIASSPRFRFKENN